MRANLRYNCVHLICSGLQTPKNNPFFLAKDNFLTNSTKKIILRLPLLPQSYSNIASKHMVHYCAFNMFQLESTLLPGEMFIALIMPPQFNPMHRLTQFLMQKMNTAYTQNNLLICLDQTLLSNCYYKN